MKLSDFPPERARDILWEILDRYHAAKERWPYGKGIKTQVHLTINDARLVYAAGQWLKRYNDWATEAEAAGSKIGVYPSSVSLPSSTEFMIGLAGTIDKDDPIITISENDMRTLTSATQHLDHYALMMSFNDKPKGGRKKR